ncbi:MAG: AroB-related putative sugar phosphate phospholyase (cyclizing) [Rhodospirillaceae bacterium]
MSETMTIQSHQGPYVVHFDEGALAKLDADVPEGAHFIIDARVAELYRAEMPNVLAAPSVLLIEATEDAKSLDKFPAYVEHLVQRRARRGEVLVAIGGGITQDITCFLAATLLRGIDWRFYPTTLLAQADSCIGSKSSINSGAAKNILGTFTPPKEIHLATAFLDTLPEADVRSGVGEMLKVHALDGPKSFDAIAADYEALLRDRATMIAYVRRSLEIKQPYIEKDEFDRGPRNVFNYGHSFGHAIEAATRFAIPHGIAVTIGMDMANWMSWRLGVGTEANYRRMHGALAANYKGFAETPVPVEPFMAAISKDKKNVGSELTLILLDKDGVAARGRHANDNGFRALSAEYLTEHR